MKPVETSWLLYGEPAIPAILLLGIFIGAVALSLWWLKGEKRRKGFSGALLPYTWTLLLLLSAWLAWRPTLVKIVRQQHPGSILIAVDESRSMDRPLAGDELPQKLDLLTLWRPESGEERATAPRDLHRALRAFLDGLAERQEGLGLARQELLQDLPMSDASQQSLREFPAWASPARSRLLDECSRVQALIDGLSQEERTALGSPAANLERLVQHIHQIPDRLQAISIGALDEALKALDAASQSGRETLPLWQTFQTALDQHFSQQHEARLKPLLEELSFKSRRHVAEELIGKLKAVNLSRVDAAQRREETDLFGLTEKILHAREDDVVSHLLMLSDGGHNGPPDSEIAQKLEKSGISFYTIGVGVPEAGHDFALMDWQARRIVPAKREFAVHVMVKVPHIAGIPCQLTLSSEGAEIGSASLTSASQPVEALTLQAKPLPEGRHRVTLRLDTSDRSKRNNQAEFVVDVVKRVPKALLLGDRPDWDTTYLCQALLRAGLEVTQFYWAVDKSPPRRGPSAREIPKTVDQWNLYRLIILSGRPFKGFTDEDAETLFRAVTEQGTSLALFVHPDTPSYLPDLAKHFRWPETSAPPGQTSSLLLPAQTDFLPLLRVGIDGPHSARLIASLGNCKKTCALPSQQFILLENSSNEPLFSLGLYGKGKVYLWSIQGIDTLREFQNAERVDRLLAQCLADAAAPLFATENDRLAIYPPFPAPEKKNLLISLAPEVETASIGPDQTPLRLEAGLANRLAWFTPPAAGTLEFRVGESALQAMAVLNPGLEEMDDEFNENFLKDFARQAKGRYLTLPQAWEALPSLSPSTWAETTSQRYPLAHHWGLMAVLAVLGALHWSLRKISGLPI